MSATIQGVGGQMTLPTGCDAKLSRWTANTRVKIIKTTGFADSGYETNKPTLVGLSGSATGIVTTENAPLAATVLASTANLAGTKGSVVLTSSASNTLSFTAIISNVKISRPNDGKADVTFDFQSSGQIIEKRVTA